MTVRAPVVGWISGPEPRAWSTAVTHAGDVPVLVKSQYDSMSSDELAVPSTTNWLRPLRWAAPSMTTPARPTSGHDGFALPVGTVTFLLTDVEGSTLGWQSAPELMGSAIARHYEILERAVAANGGVLPQEQGEGDSIVGAFGRASDALKAAVEAQQALAVEPWSEGLLTPIRVRMAMHTGEAQMRNEANYVGQAIIRTARLRAIAHGEQVLVSQAARDLAVDQLGSEVELLDLGMHRLKDLARPEHVWQVAAPGLRREFPPLKSLDAVPNNLPMDLSTFVGRQADISTVAALVETNQLITVNGTGGAGKTRLAQQVAAQLSDRFEDGTWWIELAPLHPSAVLGVIAAAVADPTARPSRPGRYDVDRAAGPVRRRSALCRPGPSGSTQLRADHRQRAFGGGVVCPPRRDTPSDRARRRPGQVSDRSSDPQRSRGFATSVDWWFPSGDASPADAGGVDRLEP